MCGFHQILAHVPVITSVSVSVSSLLIMRHEWINAWRLDALGISAVDHFYRIPSRCLGSFFQILDLGAIQPLMPPPPRVIESSL